MFLPDGSDISARSGLHRAGRKGTCTPTASATSRKSRRDVLHPDDAISCVRSSGVGAVASEATIFGRVASSDRLTIAGSST